MSSQLQEAQAERLLTGRQFVDHVRAKYLGALTISRFRKDCMDGLAPKPAAKFGRRNLYTENQAPSYVERLLKAPPARVKRKAAPLHAAE